MAKLTFSFSNQAGDIPTYEFTKEEIQSEYFNTITEQLELSEDKVFVCFQSWSTGIYSLEHQDFLISNSDIIVVQFFEKHIEHILDEDIKFNFFCFETYEDAFKYCISLKEGL